MKVRSPLPHKKARIEIIPLIDIMFFLLASFMMVSLSQTHMKGIQVNLPTKDTPPRPPEENKPVSIRVDAGGLTYWNNQLVPSDEIKMRLLDLYKTKGAEAKVSISADQMALHGDVVRVLDDARDCKIEKIGYQIKVASGEAGAPGAPGAPPPAAPPPPKP